MGVDAISVHAACPQKSALDPVPHGMKLGNENAFAAFLLSEIGYDSSWIRARRWSILIVFRAWDVGRKE